MSQGLETSGETFVDRRDYNSQTAPPLPDRRQFADSHEGLSSDARQLALAIDEYKVRHCRRFLSYEEILAVVESLGYHK
ncbi:MAG: hypothetical protein ACYTG0_34630 [Planctomycetota bacterium]|jgi:hypothetical protein